MQFPRDDNLPVGGQELCKTGIHFVVPVYCSQNCQVSLPFAVELRTIRRLGKRGDGVAQVSDRW